MTESQGRRERRVNQVCPAPAPFQDQMLPWGQHVSDFQSVLWDWGWAQGGHRMHPYGSLNTDVDKGRGLDKKRGRGGNLSQQ